MGQASLAITVSPAEHRILTTLRDMPESALRDRVHRLVKDVLAFARNPRCHEFQPDGVPCSEPSADCDQCQVVVAMLDSLERRVPKQS